MAEAKDLFPKVIAGQIILEAVQAAGGLDNESTLEWRADLSAQAGASAEADHAARTSREAQAGAGTSADHATQAAQASVQVDECKSFAGTAGAFLNCLRKFSKNKGKDKDADALDLQLTSADVSRKRINALNNRLIALNPDIDASAQKYIAEATRELLTPLVESDNNIDDLDLEAARGRDSGGLGTDYSKYLRSTFAHDHISFLKILRVVASGALIPLVVIFLLEYRVGQEVARVDTRQLLSCNGGTPSDIGIDNRRIAAPVL